MSHLLSQPKNLMLHCCISVPSFLIFCVCVCAQSLQVAQKEAQIRLLEGQLRQTDVIGSSHNHMILDALREKAEYIPELQALIHNVQQGEEWSLSFSLSPSVFSVDSQCHVQDGMATHKQCFDA